MGIHTPETSPEGDFGNLKREVKEAELNFPVMMDEHEANWNKWGNSMWPSVYLIDRKGRIRYWWYGELDWEGRKGQEIMKKRIKELLTE